MKRFKVFVAALLTAFGLYPISLFGNEPPPPDYIADGAAFMNGRVTVDGKLIDAPLAYIRGDEGNVMVPLRAAAEALGLTVLWRPENKSIVIGGDLEIMIGETEYNRSGSWGGEFGPPPEITDGRAFVSLPFFNYVLKGYKAALFEGDITIDTLPFIVYEQSDNAIGITDIGEPEDEDKEIDYSNEVIRIAKDTGESYALMHLTLGADYLADEITSARLCMRVDERDVAFTYADMPKRINIAFLSRNWDEGELTYAEARGIIASGADDAMIEYEEGWAFIDITKYIKYFISGHDRNYGIALLPVENEPPVSLLANRYISADVPYLAVSGTVGERPKGYAPYSFVKQPTEGLALTNGGNCLSYALRDNDPILADYDPEMLIMDIDEMNRLFEEDGADAVLEYTAKAAEDYINKNAEALRISGFRRIDSYNAPIEPNEYRIALRVFTNKDGNPLGWNSHLYDFHYWAQIDDGRWSQKFPGEYSHIIPGTTSDTDPAAYPWSGTTSWRGRFLEYYNSSVIYYAVTKDTAEFTNHRTQIDD